MSEGLKEEEGEGGRERRREGESEGKWEGRWKNIVWP